MKKVLLVLLVMVSVVFVSCETAPPSADQIQAKRTAQSLKQGDAQIGMPAIVNFQQKKDYKEIYELLDQENLITYTYLANSLEGKVGQFLGKSIGYGIPAATQYTSPQKLVDVTKYGISSYQANDAAVVPQADPNGLFMPTATSATFVKLIDPDGKPRVVFIEPLIIVSPFKLH